jgi:hypothetical protein
LFRLLVVGYFRLGAAAGIGGPNTLAAAVALKKIECAGVFGVFRHISFSYCSTPYYSSKPGITSLTPNAGFCVFSACCGASRLVHCPPLSSFS